MAAGVAIVPAGLLAYCCWAVDITVAVEDEGDAVAIVVDESGDVDDDDGAGAPAAGGACVPPAARDAAAVVASIAVGEV